MKKSITRTICAILTLAVAMSCIMSSFAMEPAVKTANKETDEISAVANQGRILTTSEAISTLMASEDLSYAEAVSEYDDMVAHSERIEERYVTCSLGAGYSVELGCTVTVQIGGGHCNFKTIHEKWSKASGSGSYTWDSYYVNAEITGRYDDAIHFTGRGAIEVRTTYSMSASMSAAGFSLSGTSGTTYIFRKTASLDKTWSN